MQKKKYIYIVNILKKQISLPTYTNKCIIYLYEKYISVTSNLIFVHPMIYINTECLRL